MKQPHDLSKITEDDAEEFGIDWEERDGFSVRKMRIGMLWGPDAEKPLFKRGMVQQPKLARIAQHLQAGLGTDRICALEHTDYRTIAKLRRGLKAEGLHIPEKRSGVSARDLVGTKWGRLTVMERRGSSKHHVPLWMCICECGAKKIILGESLRRGNTRSCGCLRHTSTPAKRKQKMREYSFLHAKRCRDELRDSYIRNVLKHTLFMESFPEEIIQVKRQHLLVKRQLQEMRK